MNTVEGFFSIFKRGMTGVYQHCAEKHWNGWALATRRGRHARFGGLSENA
jgi:hypothetical protein